MEFTLQINTAFEENKQVDVFYADIAKAFDTVNQSLLIRKLAKFPLCNSLLKWFISYFEDRKQYARVGSAVSDTFSVPSSVGQGTVLGPLLFLIFFNDSDDSIDVTKSYNFADDKKLARTINGLNDTAELQLSINNFIEWCGLNGLSVNKSIGIKIRR